MTMSVLAHYRSSKLHYGVLAAVALVLTAPAAQAGFEWIPAQPPAAAPDPVQSGPAASAETLLLHAEQPLSPLPPLETAEPLATAAPGDKVRVQDRSVMRVKNMTPPPSARRRPAMRAVAPGPEKLDAPETAYEVAEAAPEAVGFGREVPLALALQDIAPAGHAFLFGAGVNPGTRVSWTGGKVWTEVLRGMIAPLGLRARLRGRAVLIYQPEQPVRMIPAAGSASAGAPPVSLKGGAMTEIRRHVMHDPGEAAPEQAGEITATTVTTIEDLPPQTEIIIFEPHPDALQNRVWEAKAGDSLKQTLRRWSRENGFELQWHAAGDYRLDADLLVAGEFDEALETLLVEAVDAQKIRALSTVDYSQEPRRVTLIIENRRSRAS